MNPAPTIDAMRRAAQALKLGDPCSTVRAIQVAQDALDGAKAECLAEIEATKAFEKDGASTLNTWVRNKLRMTAADAATLVRASATFAALPLVAAAAAEGSIRADHVRVFTYGLKHLGVEIMSKLEEAFVVLAQHKDPAELFTEMRKLRDTMFPDDLDDAYVKGMEKEDISVTRLVDGWHVTGFLNAATGLKFKKDLLSGYLNNGMPSDKGIRPHVSVIVDADTLAAAAERVRATTENPHQVPDPLPPTKPAELVGYGAIGPNLLMHFACISEFTAFLMKQGDGFRQEGVCATPGCKGTHLEIHHTIFWSRGGKTNLDLLIGLCVRCHHLLHSGHLNITGNATDGFEFTKRDGAPLRRRRRRTSFHQAA